MISFFLRFSLNCSCNGNIYFTLNNLNFCYKTIHDYEFIIRIHTDGKDNLKKRFFMFNWSHMFIFSCLHYQVLYIGNFWWIESGRFHLPKHFWCILRWSKFYIALLCKLELPFPMENIFKTSNSWILQ